MLMQQLKQATQPMHVRVADLPKTLNSLPEGYSISQYQATLEAFYGFYAPFEAQLAALPYWEATDFDIMARQKTRLIADDLRVLGLSDQAIAALPRCDQLPTCTSLGHALGCLYVTEGATLGGQLLVRGIRSQLGIEPFCGSSFFNSYGNRVGPMWKAFSQYVESYAGDPEVEHDAIAAAMATFESFEYWFS
jgi:heme oxygenase